MYVFLNILTNKIEWLFDEERERGLCYDMTLFKIVSTLRFGLSRDCAQGRACDSAAEKEDEQGKTGNARKTTACTLANQCHAYRNATLDESHLVVATRMLKRFRFIGLQEAYNSSVLLLAATFDLQVEENDFEKERTSLEDGLLCKGYARRALAHDPAVCRAVMKANSLDVQLYEVQIKLDMYVFVF